MLNFRSFFLLFFIGFFSSQAFAQDREIGCVGPLPDEIRSLVDFGDRPIQREVFMGMPVNGQINRPAPGTVVRVYSQPLQLTGDFDGDGSPETVRALTEVQGPDGANPCPDGAEGDGCTLGERIIQDPYLNSTGEWSVPAVFAPNQVVTARSEDRLGTFVPTTYEIRFTSLEEGAFAFHLFTTNRIVRYPIEIWDIGEVAPGETNDPADDVQLLVTVFSDRLSSTGGDECQFGYDEIELEDGSWLSDRLYAYYFDPGVDYDTFHQGVEQFIEEYPYELLDPIMGSMQECESGKVSIFDCEGINLLSYLPKDMMGGQAGLNDLWAWTDPETGSEYALVGRRDGVSFVDVSDPFKPVYVGELATPSEVSNWRDIKVFADHAFIVADATNIGVQIFDLTQLRSVTNPPVSFQETTSYNEFTGAHNIAINEDTGFAYAVLGSGCPGLHMIDINDPQQPTFAGCFSDQERSHDVQCVTYSGPDIEHQEKEICVGSNEVLLGIVDVSNKSAPVPLSTASYPNASYIHQGWFTDDQRYFFQNDELDDAASEGYRTIVWDLLDLDNPEVLTIYEGPVPATDHNLYIKEEKAFLANYQSGLRILDISNAAAPREVAYFDTFPLNNDEGFGGAWTAYPLLESGNILVSSREEGLFVLSTQVGVSTESTGKIPSDFYLGQNYPNPVFEKTTIPYELPDASNVTIEVWDLLGRRVRHVFSGVQPAGKHEVTFGISDLPNGLYLYRFTTDSFSTTRRFIVTR